MRTELRAVRGRMVAMQTDIANLYVGYSNVEARLARVEQRLEVSDAPAHLSQKVDIHLCCRTRIASFQISTGSPDWGLEGARARGAWDGTEAILEKGTTGSSTR